MSKVQLSLRQAQNLAERIKQELSPACQRIEIAGSIRRKKPVIGDVEIVCIPKMVAVRNLFGESVRETPEALERKLADLVTARRLLRPTKNGAKFKQFGIPAVDELHLDLYITTPEAWGVIFTIRTGSAEFARKLVTQRRSGGLLPDDCHVSEGGIWRAGERLSTPEEIDVFNLIGGWTPPEKRL